MAPARNSTYSTSATESRASAAGGPDRGQRGDPACGRRADEPRLSRDPQADRAVLLRRPPARQGAGRDVAAIRAAVPHLFHRHDHARIAGRAGAGREFGQSGGAHLLALAMELQSVRDLPARLQRRRPLPDDRSGLRRGRAVLYPGAMRSRIPAAGSPASTIRAIPSHAIELASVYLDRNVAAVLARAGDVTASPQQKQDLAAFIHLCGAGPATAFARRNFQMIASERCGDHLVASLCRQGQCDEAAVPAPCGRWRELARGRLKSGPCQPLRPPLSGYC